MNSLFEQGYHGRHNTFACDSIARVSGPSSLSLSPSARRHRWLNCASPPAACLQDTDTGSKLHFSRGRTTAVLPSITASLFLTK